MPLLGYKGYNEKWQKKCLDTWLRLGSAERAAKELDSNHVSVRWNAWRYLLTHVTLAKSLIVEEAEQNNRDEFRSMSDEEFWAYLTARALWNFSPRQFERWAVKNKVYRWKTAREAYRYRFPKLYQDYPSDFQE